MSIVSKDQFQHIFECIYFSLRKGLVFCVTLNFPRLELLLPETSTPEQCRSAGEGLTVVVLLRVQIKAPALPPQLPVHPHSSLRPPYQGLNVLPMNQNLCCLLHLKHFLQVEGQCPVNHWSLKG